MHASSETVLSRLINTYLCLIIENYLITPALIVKHMQEKEAPLLNRDTHNHAGRLLLTIPC